ncbi:hypothetical protein [Streptomyces xiaopingdaonensis]|uniref:hypothetical protein n=1 Tax=Streptomyces xiaopingdaonensis TaxID=1565415 RepID=UPI00030CC1DB|nr:hypothetical protein [Streptomyces xiaopingdaonensis]
MPPAILEPLAQALSTADADVGTVFAELVEAGLGSNSRALDQWRTLMQTLSPFFKSQIAEEYGREKHEEGREEGEAHGRARSLLDVLHHRSLTVPDTAAAHILACNDLPTLDHWWHHAFTVRTVEELLTDPADGR